MSADAARFARPAQGLGGRTGETLGGLACRAALRAGLRARRVVQR
jgi:hypothetical protein